MLLVDLGAWFSLRLWPPHGPLLSGGCHRRSSQAVDPAQDRSEQRSRHRHLGQLEARIPQMPRLSADHLR
jgi:hypothetical protein